MKFLPLLGLLMAAIGSAVPVEVDVALVGAEGEVVEGAVVEAVPSDAEAQPLRQAFQAPGTASLPLSTGLWQVSAEVPGYWVAPAVVTVKEGGSLRVPLRAWPGGELRGRWLLADGQPRPETMQVRFQASTEAQEHAPEGEVECRVLVSAHFRCQLPVGTWNLRLGASGFAPAYVWAQAVGSEEPTRVGEVALRQGGSVSGWIPTCEDAGVAANCGVMLEPMAAGPSTDPQVESGLRQRRLEGTVLPNGFFQVAGVPAGTYRVVASQKAFAPADRFPVLVVEGRESELREPLVLERPVDFQVNVEPPVDPNAQPWELVIYQRGALPQARERVQQVAEAGGAGSWTWRALPPGIYDVQVRDGAGKIWESVEFEVAVGSEILDVFLDIVRVRGRVLLGDDGIPARLHWPVSLHMQADEDGEFSGLLPRQGEYVVVKVKSADPPVQWSFPRVQVEVADGAEEAWVEFRLPDTQLSGKVVDEAGRAIPGAMVAPLVNGQPGPSLVARAGGVFEFRGLPEGQVLLQATSDLGDSDPVALLLDEDMTPPEVELVVRERRDVLGFVLSPEGAGIPGARVQAWNDGMMELRTEATRGDGSFRVQLNRGAGPAFFLIQAAGYPYAPRQVQLAGDEPVRFTMGQEAGGTLVLETAFDRIDPAAPVTAFLLKDGVMVPLSELLHWRQLQGAAYDTGAVRHVVPQVEAGDWSLCVHPLGTMDPRRPRAQAQYCTGGYLAPGGELTLDATPLIDEWRKKDDS